MRADIRKKALSSLVTGRKRLLSWCHPCSALEKRPLAFCCGKGTAPVSGPAGGAVSRPPAAGPSSQGTLLWCGGVSGTCSVIAVSALTILSRKGGKVNPFPRFPAIKRAAHRAARLNHAVKGLVLGLMMSLQSRSPRSRPWINISAVATLVATGILYWSHRRVIYFRSASRSLD